MKSDSLQLEPDQIQVLSEDIINQIAAGEVVERPYSAVKELVENAIDAGADQIFVTVKNGGKDFISVYDNGRGMSAADARKSILRHATSKIRTTDDISRIMSKGFRGEALAAISSVSRMQILTCRNEAEGGTLLNIEAGEVKNSGSIAFPRGTKITVENLFYNTPARRGFLKNDRTELGHISEWIIQNAIGNPQIHFKLSHNGQLMYDFCKATSLEERVRECVGMEVAEHMVQVSYEESYINVSGLVCEPMATRASKRWQFIYINDRHVRDKTVSFAVYEGYKTLLMKGQHPVFFLKVNISPSEVDVNVHPAKTEVRLKNRTLVSTIVAGAIRDAIRQHSRNKLGGTIPSSQERKTNQTSSSFAAIEASHSSRGQLPVELGKPNFIEKAPVKSGHVSSFPVGKSEKPNSRGVKQEDVVIVGDGKHQSPEKPQENIAQRMGANSKGKAILTGSSQQEEANTEEGKSENPFMDSSFRKVSERPVESSSGNRLRAIGEYGKYIVASDFIKGGMGLVVADKHAAHERVRFEEIRTAYFSQKEPQMQAMLAPLTFALTPRDALLLNGDLDHWRRIGFDIEEFGKNTFKLSQIPMLLAGAKLDYVKMILDILDELAMFGKAGKQEIYLNKIFEKMACHSSIRGEKHMTIEEMDGLLNKLTELDINLYCPHGRPVLIWLSEAELERKFKRIV